MMIQHIKTFYCSNMKNELKCFHNKIKWVNFAWMQDSWGLLKLDSISWLKTLENNFIQWPVVNTLFQETMDHHNHEDGFRETQILDPCWKSRPAACRVSMELKLEFGPRAETILTLGFEFLMDQINLWWIRTTTIQKFLKISLKNKRYSWKWTILHADQRQKRNHKGGNLRVIHQASFRWTEGIGLILNQGITLSLSAYEVSKKVIHPLRHSQQVQREEDGAVHFWRIKENLQSQFPQIPHWSDNRWKACLAAGGGTKRRYQYCTDVSKIIVYFRALQGHSGRNLIDPLLQDNVKIQSGFFHHIYHFGCAFNLQSVINNGLKLGGQNSSKRQTVFFLPIDPRDKSHKYFEKIDLDVPRRAQYLHNAWKKHQDAVYWVDIDLAIRKGLTFHQTRSNAIIFQGILPAYCIPKVVRLKTWEVLYEKAYKSPRPQPKIYLRHDWTKKLGSKVDRQPEGEIARQQGGEVAQQAKFFQPTRPIPNPIRDRSGRPGITQDVICVQDERKTSRSLEISVNSFTEELCSSDRSGRPGITQDVISAEDSKSLNVEQTHDRSGRPGKHTVAVQDDWGISWGRNAQHQQWDNS